MDFDRNQFLTDVFETVLSMSGDPVRNLDAAITFVIDRHVKGLRKLAQEHREALIGMAEERERTGKAVKSRWKV